MSNGSAESIFEKMSEHEHEQVVFCYNKAAGLKAIIAIHDTTLGPSLGGLRMWPYKTEQEALHDVLRLSRAMTYKAAAAGLNLGGGKAVIIGDSQAEKTEFLFRAFGRFVESLNGRYITAEDVGTTVWDMDYISAETRYVTGLVTSKGGSGDPSPFTAFGVYQGMRACLAEAFETPSVRGKTVAIQGLGNVGSHLAKYVHENGGKLIVTDINKELIEKVVKNTGARAVESDAIYDQDCDVFAPCALGGVLNDQTIPRLKCRIIAGAANNQCAEDIKHSRMLMDRGIIHAPDFVINAGGLMNVYEELEGYNRERALQKVSQLFQSVKRILETARKQNITTQEAAHEVARQRIGLLKNIKHTYLNRIG